jgi:hypothetical protein
MGGQSQLSMASLSKSATTSGKIAQCSRVHGESSIELELTYLCPSAVVCWSIDTSKYLTGADMLTPHSSTAIINLDVSPRVRVEAEGYESLVMNSAELMVLRESVSMIMLANPAKTAPIIAKENNPPVTDRYSISLSKRSI